MTGEKFVIIVENTANVAIAAGRDVNEVIHDTIEVLYERKNINELLPSGWIIANNCSECAYKDDPGYSDTCFRCYNKLFNKNIIRLDPGPYTNNFKSKDKKENPMGDAPQRECTDCVHIDDVSPCRSCIDKSEKPNFTPIKRSAPLDRKKEKDPEEQKHVEVEEGRYCHDCKYEELKTEELPCHNCFWDVARPNFTPKEE